MGIGEYALDKKSEEIRRENSAKKVVRDLEQLLVDMSKIGKPRVSRMNDGWYSGIEIFNNIDGVTFEVKSEFNHQTPWDAAKQCQERALAAIRKVTGSLK